MNEPAGSAVIVAAMVPLVARDVGIHLVAFGCSASLPFAGEAGSP